MCNLETIGRLQVTSTFNGSIQEYREHIQWNHQCNGDMWFECDYCFAIKHCDCEKIYTSHDEIRKDKIQFLESQQYVDDFYSFEYGSYLTHFVKLKSVLDDLPETHAKIMFSPAKLMSLNNDEEAFWSYVDQ